MTPYEMARLASLRVAGVLPWMVRKELKRLLPSSPTEARILDVGARSSPYTIGLPCRVTMLDIPQESKVQEKLNLGYSEQLLEMISRRRSNVEDVVLADMAKCPLPSEYFDGAVSVETIEHVDDPEGFVAQVARVLKPLGWFYLTTPNGDYIPNTNPDHRRHFRRVDLEGLLSRHFGLTSVIYGVRTGKHHLRSIEGLRLHNPAASLGVVKSSLVNRAQSRGLAGQPRRTANLFATAWKI